MKKIALAFSVFLGIVLIGFLPGTQATSTGEVSAGDVKVEVAGDVQQVQTAPTLDLTISLPELSWEKLLELLPPALGDQLQDLGLSGVGNITIQPKGPLDNLVISGEFDLSKSGIRFQNIFAKPETVRTMLAFEVGLKSDSLVLSSLTFSLGEFVLDISGSVSNFENPVLDLRLTSNEFLIADLLSFFPELTATISEADPKALQADGGGILQASAKGPVDDLDLDLKIDLDKSDITFKDLFRKSAQSPGNITAQAHLGKDAVSIKEVSVNLGTFQLTTQGTVSNFQAPDLDVVLETNLFDIEALLTHFPIVTAQYLPPELTLAGSGKLRLASKGSLEDLTISGSVDMSQGKIAFGEYFTKAKDIPGRLDFDTTITKDAVEIRQVQLNLNDVLLDITGLISGLQQDAMLDLSLMSEPITFNQLLDLGFRDMDAMQAVATQYQGQIDLSLQVEGAVANPQGRAHVSLNHLRYKGVPIDDITCDVSLAQQQIQATLTAFRNMVNASFDVVLTPELPYQAKLVMEHAELECLFAFVVDTENISGRMTGKVTSEGSLSDLRHLSGEVTLSDLSLDIAGQIFSNRQPIDLVMTQQKLVVNSFELRGENLRVFSTGFVDFQGESNLDVDGILDLLLIQPFLPATLGISSLAGRIHLLGTVVGTLKDPSLLGIAEIHHGRVRSSAYPETVTNINGRVNLAQGKIAIPRLVGRVSKGDIFIHGELAYSDRTPDHFSVKMTGERLVLKEVIESLELTISPSLTFSGDLQKQVLAGNLVIHEALYNQDLDAIMSKQGDQERTISLITADTFNPSQSTPAKTQPMTLDLSLTTAQDVKIRNRQAVLDLRADLHIRGSPARPQIKGLLEVVKGGFFLFNVRYNVLSARFDFFDPRRINPEMNILLETLIQQYTITVGLEGNLERLSLSTRSDPVLSENEILALLLWGAGRHLRPLQGPILGWLEETSRNLFDLDRVTLETAPLAFQGRGTQASPSLTLVKRLFDKLLLTYITTVGGKEKFQIFQGEYEFSDKVSTIIRGDEKGDMDTAVIFEFDMK